MVYRAVVFDLLTALIDSWSLWDAAAGGEESGRRWRARYLDLTYGCGAYQPYEDLVAAAANYAGLPSAASEALAMRWDELSPWPEVPGVLAALKGRGLLLGVATNCSIAKGRRAAARCGVPFDAVVTSEEAGYYKPRPEPYRLVLSALGVTASEALFVAGSPSDVPGASAVGMPVVWHNRVGLPSRPGAVPLREARTLDAALEGLA